MNEQAIKKLRRKFILIAFFSLLTVLIIMSTTIYHVNFFSTERQIRNTLNYLTDNEGKIAPSPVIEWDIVPATVDSANDPENGIWETMIEIFRDALNTQLDEKSEAVYGLRYFAVVMNEEDSSPITTHIAEIDEKTAFTYAQRALDSGQQYGIIGDYSFEVRQTKDKTLVVFLNVANQLADAHRIGIIVFLLTVFGSGLSFIIIRILSNHAIRPEIRNAENQQRFITNASHELKTPLAVIRANTELEMMIHGEDEWNQSTMNQVDRMTGLIQNLVMIAKADEKANKEDRSDTNISQIVSETVDNFATLAAQNDKLLTKSIPENIHMNASESQVRQLTSLFIDNAIKYCDDNGAITVTLQQKGKGVKIAVSNLYAAGEGMDFSRFFDRFYREDQSHNIDKGGYGIGLSIADSIVRQYRGKIDVTYQKGVIEFSAVLKE